jgi:hypothetical protein
VKDAIRARLADAVDTLSDLDTLIEQRAGRLAPILLARAMVEIDAAAAGLARLRQRLTNAIADLRPARAPGTRPKRDNATGAPVREPQGWQEMAENGRGNRDAALLAALAAGSTVRQAAQQAGVSERTAHRRLADDTFRRRVTELRGEMVARALGKMADGMAEAADTLRQLLRAESETVRRGACRAALELTVKLRETVELEERLAAVESRLSGESGT